MNKYGKYITAKSFSVVRFTVLLSFKLFSQVAFERGLVSPLRSRGTQRAFFEEGEAEYDNHNQSESSGRNGKEKSAAEATGHKPNSILKNSLQENNIDNDESVTALLSSMGVSESHRR